MKIRQKFLTLLLVIALAPMAIGTLVHRLSSYRLSKRMAAEFKEALTAREQRLLERAVADYGNILNSKKEMIELALVLQAREVEHRLASEPPPYTAPFFAGDYDEGIRLPPDMEDSTMHYKLGDGGSAKGSCGHHRY